ALLLVPKPHCVVPPAGKGSLAVGGDGNAGGDLPVSHAANFRRVGYVPNPHRMILADGKDVLAVWCKRGPPVAVLVPFELLLFLARGQVPYPNRASPIVAFRRPVGLVARRRQQMVAVG